MVRPRTDPGSSCNDEGMDHNDGAGRFRNEVVAIEYLAECALLTCRQRLLHFLSCILASPVYPGSMNALAYRFMNTMESETSAIAAASAGVIPTCSTISSSNIQHRLLRYLIYLSGNRELAEDLFQETWIRVLERGHQYDGRHEFSTWLYAVARNLTIDYLRKKSPVSLDGLMENDEHAPFEPPDPRPMAWEVVQQHEQAERVSAALIGIPAEYREAVVLRFQEGLALEEIADSDRGAPGHGEVAAVSRIKHADVAAEGSAGMTRNEHDEARELIAAGGCVSDAQQAWLRAHIDECEACRQYAETANGVVRTLRSLPLAADARLVRATQMRVRFHASRLREARERMWLVGMACLARGSFRDPERSFPVAALCLDGRTGGSLDRGLADQLHGFLHCRRRWR